jgi:hypothetical protein
MDNERPARNPTRNPIVLAWKAMGSLKLTVTLLGMSIFLVFAGTLAQVDKGIWTVMEQYFRCWIAHIEPRIFARSWDIQGSFPFPGGWLIGTALLVNLIVSHTSRIRLEARGARLGLGTGVLAVGVALTWLVIAHVFDADSSEHKIAPSLRITYQLLQGGGSAVVLFMGCKMLFGRKAGIVLLHSGIVLMMFSELVTAKTAHEASMSVYEGQSINYVEDSRGAELAVIDPSGPASDDVVAVPEELFREGQLVSSPELPFDIDPSGAPFIKNSNLREAEGKVRNPATAGSGLHWVAEKASESAGASTSGAVDESAAYLTFRDKKSGASLGTFLVAVRFSLNRVPQQVAAGGKVYDVYLRFKRTYKPYAIYLYKFKFERYPGTNTPKDYSSFVRLTDHERGTSRDVRIWMNNPLRYRGDTLYQASFDAQTEAGTVLQVVTNSGWMVPYLGCMIVAVGLLGQFMLHLVGFLQKRAG